MRVLLRLIGGWAVLNGLVLLALALSHVDTVTNDLGASRSVATAAGTAVVLLLVTASGGAAVLGGVNLCRLKSSGRTLALLVFSFMALLLVSAGVVGQVPTTAVFGPLCLSLAVVAVLASPPARRACSA